MFKDIRLVIIFAFISIYLIPSSSIADDEIPSDLQTAPTSDFFNKKLMGKIVIYSDKDIKNNSIISISPMIQQTKAFYIVGKTKLNEAYEIALLPGEYRIDIDTKSGFLSPAIARNQKFIIEGGKIVYARASGESIFIEPLTNVKFETIKEGALQAWVHLARIFQAEARIMSWITKNQFIYFGINLRGYTEDPIFSINDIIVTPDTLSWKTSNTIRFIKDPHFKYGANTFSISVIGADGNAKTAKYDYYEKSLIEIEQEKIANENAQRIAKETAQRIADEKRREEARIAELRRKEAERITREGDGTPDDLSCKKYGLLPQTQGYAECRMRLDLIRKEELARGAANDRVRAEELARRNQQIEEQNAIVHNRASQCQFVRAQEYLRPGLNFATAAQNAESAYSNCMAGVPQIQTTCTRDGFGNMNCTSR